MLMCETFRSQISKLLLMDSFSRLRSCLNDIPYFIPIFRHDRKNPVDTFR